MKHTSVVVIQQVKSGEDEMLVNAYISVIIPNHNGAATIEQCLTAACASQYDNFEVVVVDDCSTDHSTELIQKYPCRLIQLKKQVGAAIARNIGVKHSCGDLLFFTDADCVLQHDTLAAAYEEHIRHTGDIIVGGTYTMRPYDQTFFSIFQSVFIHLSETKNITHPDYIATHALMMTRSRFLQSNGFADDFMPILEDVEFCHRLKSQGCRLVTNPGILVQHIFNYSLFNSLQNGFKKSKYWTAYSIKEKDLLVDSGTASVELKFNVTSFLLLVMLISVGLLWQESLPLYAGGALFFINILVNRKLFLAFYKTRGIIFMFFALLYYMLIYPLAVGLGAIAGIKLHLSGKQI